MSSFRLIRRVLDRLEGPLAAEFGAGLNGELVAKLGYLSRSYYRLHGGAAQDVDYSERSTQFCYTFKYIAAHADYLFKVLRRMRTPNGGRLFDEEEVTIACLGGGPGSDVLAVVRYLAWAGEKEPAKKVTFDIYDKEPGWFSVVEAIVEEAESDIQFEVIFHSFDVSNEGTWSEIEFDKYDLITSSFFVSEIKRIGLSVPARRFWRFLLRNMSTDALMAFNDNGDERIYGYFDRLIEAAGGFDTLTAEDDEEVSCGDSFDPVQPWINRLDHRPRRNGKTANRGLVKR